MNLKKIFITLVLLALTIAPSFTVYSQQKSSNIVTTDQTIAFLLKDKAEMQAELDAKEQRIRDLETENALEKENSASVSKSYEAAKSEITKLRSDVELLRKAVSVYESTVALLQTDNAKQKEIAKKANKSKWKARGAAALLLVLEVVRVIH